MDLQQPVAAGLREVEVRCLAPDEVAAATVEVGDAADLEVAVTEVILEVGEVGEVLEGEDQPTEPTRAGEARTATMLMKSSKGQAWMATASIQTRM